MKMKMHTYIKREDNFIITAPTYKIMVQSTLPAFLRIMDGYGTHDKKNDLFRMHEGGTCFFRTETDPDSIVGIPNVKHIWGDEAGKYRLYFWENMQARADATGCGIDLTTSPYSRNWVYTELVKPSLLGKRPDVDLIQAASWENPYHSLHDPVKRRLKRETMDPRRFDMQYGGEWGQMAGLVYDCWDNEQNLIPECKLPPGTKYYAGIDWGFTDPFVLKVRAVLPNGEQIGVSEFYKTGQTISDIKEVCAKKKKIYDIQMFFCDPSAPGSIEELNRAGIPAVGANNDIRRGIDAHYELIKTRKYKEFIGACPYSCDEREFYHYPEPEDLGPDDDSKEQLPVDANNHGQDCDRYLTLSLAATADKRRPIVSDGKPKIHRDDVRAYFESLKKKRPGGRVINDL
jgi:hypothetical protein